MEIYAGFDNIFSCIFCVFLSFFLCVCFAPEFPAEIYASFVWVVAGVSHDFFFSDV